ncbi:MAG: hypothetical protein QOK48_3209 [Blastocatellia bacterium]|nr:hypothetical protein [Blastocatellia bacterium]
MKTLYAFALALLLVSIILVAFPSTLTVAANCKADCDTGEVINIKEVTHCSCMDNVGCAWMKTGKRYAKQCGSTALCVTVFFSNDF